MLRLRSGLQPRGYKQLFKYHVFKKAKLVILKFKKKKNLNTIYHISKKRPAYVCRFQFPPRDGRCVLGPEKYSPYHTYTRLLAIPTSCFRVAENNPN